MIGRNSGVQSTRDTYRCRRTPRPPRNDTLRVSHMLETSTATAPKPSAAQSTIDPVRAAVPLPSIIDPRCVGAAVRGLATLRLIHRAGLARSVRPMAHGRDLPVWEIADHDAASAWLADHPDLPEPDPG